MKWLSIALLYLTTSGSYLCAQSTAQLMRVIEQGFDVYVQQKRNILAARTPICPIATTIQYNISHFKINTKSIKKDNAFLSVHGEWQCEWREVPEHVLGIVKDCDEKRLYKEQENVHFVAILSTQTSQPKLIRIINPAFQPNEFEFQIFPLRY